MQVLPLHEVLAFCVRHSLPSNDAWLVASTEDAARMRECLDRVATEGSPTAEAVAALNALVDTSQSGALHMPGGYPHEAWQGSRVEGFVVAQGPAISAGLTREMQGVSGALRGLRLDARRVEEQSADLLRPATALLGAGRVAQSEDSGGEEGSLGGHAVAAVRRHLPDVAHLLVRSHYSCLYAKLLRHAVFAACAQTVRTCPTPVAR